MRFDINWVKSKYAEKGKLDYLFFWGHRRKKDGSIGKSCFSQWWESTFKVADKEFKSAEHWMMYKKAELFGDQAMMSKILDAKTPKDAKALGRLVKNFKEEKWLAQRYQIVKEGNLHKFNQDERLKAFLIGTTGKILVEASPYDKIWGIGLQQDHADCRNPNKWDGLNLLGFVLMEVREELTK